MIAEEVFAREWRILCERFNREATADLAARYHESLSPRMDTDQFRHACRVLFDSRQFFPGPDDFLKAVEGSSEEQALDQWDLCWSAMEGRDEPLARMSEAGRKTVRLMGGIRHLRNSSLDNVRFLRHEFLRLYGHAHETYERELKRLPAWTEEGREVFDELTKPKQIGPATGTTG